MHAYAKPAALALFLNAALPALPLVLGATAPSLALQPVKYWEDKFLGAWQSELDEYLPTSNSGDSWPYYNLGYAIDANASMFAATGNTKYLDRALLYVENVIAQAKPSSTLSTSQYKDKYLGWISLREGASGEIPLYESYCWRYVTRLLRHMQANPQVFADPAYRKKYQDILLFTEVNMFQKWYTRGQSNLYRENTHMASHWAYIGLELSLLGATSDSAWKERYRTVNTNINLHFPNQRNNGIRGQLMAHPRDSAAYFWSANWGDKSLPGQDVSHGNNLMAYIVEAHDVGVEWTDADMRKFMNTLNAHIWPAAGTYADFVDGSGTGNGWFNDGFCKLGRYDAALQERLEKSTVGRNTQLYGILAENAYRLAQSVNGIRPLWPSSRKEAGGQKWMGVAADGRIILNPGDGRGIKGPMRVFLVIGR